MVVYAIAARTCSECPKVLPLECFPTANRKKDGAYGRRSRCPECHRTRLAAMPSRTSPAARERKQERYRERRADPVEAERLRQGNRESRRRRARVSAEALEGQRRAAREYQRRRRADPAWRAAENKRLRDRRAHLREHDPDGWLRLCERDRKNHNRRMKNAKARARRNEAARLAKANRTAARLGSGYEYRPTGLSVVDCEDGVMLPVAPLLEYVGEKIELERRALNVAAGVYDRATDGAMAQELGADGLLPPEARFCARVGFDSRNLRRWRAAPGSTVNLDLVDRVLTAYDEPYLLDVLYPDVDELLAS